MTDFDHIERERQIAENVEIGAAAIKARSEQLGRVLSGPERWWLLRGVFVHRFGEVLGEAVAAEVEAALKVDGDSDGTGVRRR